MADINIREFWIPIPGGSRRVSIDLKAVTAVEELNPRLEHDQAACLVFVEGIPNPYRVMDSYDPVVTHWKSAGVYIQMSGT